MAAAQQAMHALRRSPFLRFGVGAGTAVVTERALSTATGNPQALTHWLAGTTAGGSVFGFIGCETVMGAAWGGVYGLGTIAIYFWVTDVLKES